MSDFEIGPGEIAGMLRAAGWHEHQRAIFAQAIANRIAGGLNNWGEHRLQMEFHRDAAADLRDLARSRASEIPGHQIEALGGDSLK